MTIRAAAIRLKIPDNEAYTALAALRRLGVQTGRIERSQIWVFDDDGDERDFAQRVMANESLFNPNKHELELLAGDRPREGEAWIAELDAREEPVRVRGVRGGRRYVAWRLFEHGHEPASPQTVRAAVEKLLCNPAIERAMYS